MSGLGPEQCLHPPFKVLCASGPSRYSLAFIRLTSINPRTTYGAAARNGYILPVINVCANYQFRASTKVYQTRVLYEAVHIENGVRFFEVGKGVPAKEIRMMRNELSEDAY